MKNTGNFYQTTFLVTFLSVAERALGFLYRVVLARLLGAEGLGIYQIALSHFSLFRTLGGGGLPVATSRLIAKNNAIAVQGEKDKNGGALTCAILLSLAITLPLTLLFLFFGEHFAFLLGKQSISSLKILLCGLSFTCVYAVFKGFFWGNGQFLAPALLEMGEEIVTVCAGVLLLKSFGNGLDAVGGSNLAALSCLLAFVLSCIVSFLLFLPYKKQVPRLRPTAPLFREVASAALPVTGVRVSSTVVSAILAVLLPVMLTKTGISEAQATAEFGVATGMALPLLSMPLTLVGSFALVLMPRLSEDFYAENYERLYVNVERGLTCAVFVACLLAPFFFVLGKRIGLLTYGNALAGDLLRNGCRLLLPMSFCMISTTALNSMGFEKKSLFYYLIGAAAMLLCVCFLPRFIGIYAYPAGIFAQYLISGILNTVTLFQKRKPSAFFLKKTVKAAVFCLPVACLGEGIQALLANWCGAYLNMALTALVMSIASVALYMAFGMFSPGFLRKIFAKK